MILIKPSFEILAVNGADLSLLEKAGRTCYQSEPKGRPIPFIQRLINSGHETIIEHGSMTVKFIVDRGFTHELVRHRMAVYSQESTRWCNYSGGVTFIIPPWVDIEPGKYNTPSDFAGNYYTDEVWFNHMLTSENNYIECLRQEWTPQQARTVLPNSLKTEIVMTANFREWRLVFKQRALGLTGKPHPQMLEIMIPLLQTSCLLVPGIFNDLMEQLQ